MLDGKKHDLLCNLPILSSDFKELIDNDASKIYDLYELCIKHGIEFDDVVKDPFLCYSMKQLRDVEKTVKETIKRSKKTSLPSISKEFRNLQCSESNKVKNMLSFEHKMMNVKLHECPCCKSSFLHSNDKPLQKNALCQQCKNLNGFKIDSKSSLDHIEQRRHFLLENEILPVWYHKDDVSKKNPQYHIPDALRNLSHGELLLIQRYSAFVPIFHMSRGHTAIKGHCVCFFQDNTEMCNELPRKRCDIVKVIKESDDHGNTIMNSFIINKWKVLNALRWLKDHHRYYKDIEIKEENLSWMTSDECEMTSEVMNIVNEAVQQPEKSRQSAECFVSNVQCSTDNEENEYQCYVNNSLDPTINDTDKDIMRQLNEEFNLSNKDFSFMKFPDISDIPINEYTEDILPNIFPHLYPGGIGGCNNNFNGCNQNLHKYAKRLVNYFDGRFASDKVWSFYMLDMIQRSKNNSSGNYIIKDGFLGKACQTVDDLKEKIKKGDYSWINLLRNYSKRIRGSDNYWRGKRHEVESWINYHVEQKHGPPSLFITLSCAENWWKDLIRILTEKLKNTPHEYLIQKLKSNDSKERMSARCKVSTLFSVTVQEFFQIRVQHWIETVGKKVFKIKHYWARFEFAKGRGQIHLHMLAIVENIHIQKQYFELKNNENHEEAVKLMCNYARVELGLIAEHPAVCTTDNISDHNNVSGYDLFKDKLFFIIFLKLFCVE